MFSLANTATTRVAKTLQGIASYYNSDIDDFEALVEVESQSDNKYELANLDFPPAHERQPKSCHKTVAEFNEWHEIIAEFTEW